MSPLRRRYASASMMSLLAALALAPGAASAKDWYVSAARGKGKKGTMKKPAKDLGNILKKLEPGDKIHIAEGVYTGRGDNGHTQVLVPVEIYGGYSDDFSTRDPWGKHKTILGGVNSSDNWKGGYRLSIKLDKWRDSKQWPAKGRYDEPEHRVVVDGVIVDNGDRNRYKEGAETCIVRTANPKLKKNPTPESGGISVTPWKKGDVVIRNCVILNTAPTQGVLAVHANKLSKVLIENNLVVNNTGNGLHLMLAFHGDEAEQPRVMVRNNTSLFNHKHDPFATYGGSGLAMEKGARIIATGNVLGMNDYYGVDNVKRAEAVILNDNVIFGNLQADYVEFDTRISLEDLEDEAENLDEAEDNSSEVPPLPLSDEYKKLYYARNVIDRNAAEMDVKVKGTYENAWRSILGLNLKGTDLKVDSEVWLPRIQVDDALKLAAGVAGKGAKSPGNTPAEAGGFSGFDAFDE